VINAVAIQSHAAADLTYPALLLEGYLEALMAGGTPEVPSSAIWAIENFMRDATEDEQNRVDPVASAVSYQLADTAVRAVKRSADSFDEVDELLSTFLTFVRRLLTDPAAAAEERDVAEDLVKFLRSIRLRGQGDSYNRLASCV
jgi:hypothetical protein